MRWSRPALVLGAVAALGALAPTGAGGQLRPLDPMDWDDLGRESRTLVIGAATHWGQRASRAGAEGRLVELGRFRAVWGLGRVSMEFAGTARWLFDERSVYREATQDVLPAQGTRRHDSGDYRVSTVVRLTRAEVGNALALRFGVRLPTTDNLQGLDRDQTDFFALLGGRTGTGTIEVGGELGVGVFGTRDLTHEQVDVLLFALRARAGSGSVRGVLELAGHHDTRAGPELRGNEDLGEARLGVRAGRERWVKAMLIRGWTPASPDFGVTVEFGKRF